MRALIDDRGRPVKSAGPSTPVEVLGLTSLPQPGDPFQTVADAAKARQIATFRQAQAKERALGAKGGRLTLESLQGADRRRRREGAAAHRQGRRAGLGRSAGRHADQAVGREGQDPHHPLRRRRHQRVGRAARLGVERDHHRLQRAARIATPQDVAEREEVDIRLHSVIYNVTDEIKKGMAGLLDPTFKEVRIGAAEVREVFKVPKIGAIAGCMVTDGRITRAGETQARLLRDNVVVHEGKIGVAAPLQGRRQRGEVRASSAASASQNYNDIKVGDVIEVFTMERVAVTA